MAQNTSIEWTDMSVNPFRAKLDGHVGHYCEKISAGCTNCYASRMQSRFQMPPYQANKNKGVEVFLDESKLMDVLRRKKPTTFFWCDMTDMFLDCYPDQWIDKCFAVMALTPWHTHQILTKRERMQKYLNADATMTRISQELAAILRYNLNIRIDVAAWQLEGQGIESRHDDYEDVSYSPEWPLPNVWLGTSVEDQKTADERIPILLQTPAAVRFISAEPLLGDVDLGEYLPFAPPPEAESDGQSGLDWVIIGGESGPKARPFDIEWARSIIEQCQQADVPVFMKQLGSMPTITEKEWRAEGGVMGETMLLSGRSAPKGFVSLKFSSKGGDMSEWPEELRIREFPKQEVTA